MVLRRLLSRPAAMKVGGDFVVSIPLDFDVNLQD